MNLNISVNSLDTSIVQAVLHEYGIRHVNEFSKKIHIHKHRPFNEFAKPVIYSGLELPSNLNSSSKRKDYNIASEENENTDKS